MLLYFWRRFELGLFESSGEWLVTVISKDDNRASFVQVLSTASVVEMFSNVVIEQLSTQRATVINQGGSIVIIESINSVTILNAAPQNISLLDPTPIQVTVKDEVH